MKDKLRYSISHLIRLVFLCGVGFAALRSPTMFWESGLLMLLILTLAFAIVRAIVTTDRQRASSAGFAVFGCLYLAVALIPPLGTRLPTTQWLTHWTNVRFSNVNVQEVALDQGTVLLSANSIAFSSSGQYLATDLVTSSGGPANSTTTGSPSRVLIWNTVSPQTQNSGPAHQFFFIGQLLCSWIMALVGGWTACWIYDRRSNSLNEVKAS